MRRAILLGLAGVGIVVAVLAIVAGEPDHPRSAGVPATPGSRAAPAERSATGRCRQIPLPVAPDRLVLVGSRLLIASSQARSVEAADVRACRWLATLVRLPNHAKVTPPPPPPGVIQGPDRPHGLAADRHSLWVVGELTLYRYDLATRRLTARVPLPGLALVLSRGVLWAANLTEGPTFIYGIDGRSGTVRSKQPGDSEIVGLAAGSAAVWAVSHDRRTLLRVDPRSGRVTRRTKVSSDPHGVAFGSGVVWVALYHQSTIAGVDPRSGRILGPPIHTGFPTELMASAGGRLWAIPSVGGYLADPQLHAVLEIDTRSGHIVRSYRTRGRPRDVVAGGKQVWVATTEPNELVSFADAAAR
jgi:hypothetical protein